MNEPKWLTRGMALAIHAEALAQFGGSPGLRDAGLLESALARPAQIFAYGTGPTLFDLAAALCLGIAKNHAFVDGNKRTALLCARAFLFLNGWAFEPAEEDEVRLLTAAAAGEADEKTLAAWFEEFSTQAPVAHGK